MFNTCLHSLHFVYCNDQHISVTDYRSCIELFNIYTVTVYMSCIVMLKTFNITVYMS